MNSTTSTPLRHCSTTQASRLTSSWIPVAAAFNPQNNSSGETGATSSVRASERGHPQRRATRSQTRLSGSSPAANVTVPATAARRDTTITAARLTRCNPAHKPGSGSKLTSSSSYETQTRLSENRGAPTSASTLVPRVVALAQLSYDESV